MADGVRCGLFGAGEELEPVGATATFVIVVGHGWGLSLVGDKGRVGAITLEARIVWGGKMEVTSSARHLWC